ncbi:MAG: GTP 3',8-cyclase MoaA [Dehalococcoidia bacterium]
MIDALNRPLRDLRISVTDRCNFRCTYCMPKEVFGSDFQFLQRADLLSFEEIARLSRIFVGQGVEKLRLTGGEPLVRRDIEKLIELLTAIPGLKDIALTTNGSLLTPRKAQALKAAGLKRITVSLDALDDETFMSMNDIGFPVSRVLDGIAAAAAAGLAPVKVDMVVKRGVNEHAILPMAEHFRGSGYILRFIEFMDVGNVNGWRMDDVISGREILDIIGARWPLEPVEANYAGEVASRYRYLDGAGEIGLITSVTQPFCSSCTRARLSADGHLYTCLFGIKGHAFRGPLRDGSSDEQIAAFLKSVWSVRNDRYSEIRFENTPGPHACGRKVEMSHIGG